MTSDIQTYDGTEFFDYYDFLGIPPAAPPNLVYLAILKIEKSLKENSLMDNEDYITNVKAILGDIYDNLLSEEDKRLQYEKEWLSYYFPRDKYQTNIKSMKLNSHNSTLLSTGLKQKSAPLVKKEKKNQTFDYSSDFSYLMMCDRPKERNVFFLDTEQEIHLPPYSDYIHFNKDQFFLSTHGEVKVSIINDALGKHVICSTASKEIPLHIGDRMEFESGTRLILRGFYTKSTENSPTKKWGIHLVQENVILPLEENKNYVFGRNTSDIRSLSFDEEMFCFVNIGRRERSISRQNFQMFYHNGSWYLKDLGSRYGTTLDLGNHHKFETLIGGSIMKLEIGRIRLGYDKSYLIEVDEIDKLQKNTSLEIETCDYTTIYDIPLF
ncbi:FHA domain-containing protein [Candidatus Uabimicrobium sp. HlEnr_7]|uniref:FHA domain-containing protein n=1 Tax=Candidatus Uabimicrobium helgolandensis TaxID=3095367 RepID=UPI00355647A4